jgi:OmpA-OmpF porin, OOP family
MRSLFACALLVLPSIGAAEDYFGVLRPPAPAAFAPGAYYAFSSLAASPLASASDASHRFRLGYRHSPYLAMESELTDYARAPNPFANPASLASAFRSTGFALDAVATLPLWRFSFYGRMGAYRGDRNGPLQLAGVQAFDPMRGTRWRYGLGLRYDITSSLGLQAELERHSLNIGSPLAGDVDTDQLSVGLSWRF